MSRGLGVRVLWIARAFSAVVSGEPDGQTGDTCALESFVLRQRTFHRSTYVEMTFEAGSLQEARHKPNSKLRGRLDCFEYPAVLIIL